MIEPIVGEAAARYGYLARGSALRRFLLFIGVATLVAVGCGGEGDSASSGPGPDLGGPVHVHGLGLNPGDDALFIATHTGLFRAAEGARRSERVGDRAQDTMGFTVVGPDHFLGSGHPDLREDLPPLLGLIESRDAGATWEPVSLLGEADFHVLEAARNRVYGFDASGGRLLASRDGGETWARRPPPEPLVSLAIHPVDPRLVVASGEQALYVSRDEGRRWRRIARAGGLLAWPKPSRMYLIAADGRVTRSDGIGKAWREVGDLGGQPAAFESESESELYAALHDGTVKRSADGGESWGVRSRP
jgi:hypothetical protein